MKKILFSLLLISSSANAEMLFSPEKENEWCLAQNIYYEARGSSFADQVAVADVVLNRVQSAQYPNSICEVVRQGKVRNGLPVRNMCQFSWYCDGKSDYPTNQDAWIHSQYIAYRMIHFDEFRGLTEGATHYHANYVNPKWAKHLQHIGRIGDHIFYR